MTLQVSDLRRSEDFPTLTLHGTKRHFVENIQREGIIPGGHCTDRIHVHLFGIETIEEVRARTTKALGKRGDEHSSRLSYLVSAW